MRSFLLIFFICISSFLSAQELKDSSKEVKDSTILHTFIHQLANPDIALDIILSQYVIVEEPTNELYDYLEASLDEIRINLLSKKIEEIKYIPYLKTPKKEIKDIDLEGLEPRNIYFLSYREKQILAIYLEDDKIGSFTLVAKGNGKAHFVLY